MFGIPYRKTPLEGYWGVVNSKTKYEISYLYYESHEISDNVCSFCEEDYIITSLAAEFINTLTNFIYGTSMLS